MPRPSLLAWPGSEACGLAFASGTSRFSRQLRMNILAGSSAACYTHAVSIADGQEPPRASALEPEYVVLGLLIQQAGHGYDLHLRLQAAFRSMWRIPQNQLYSTLKRLETRGDILGEERDSSAGPKRRHYKVTRRGRARFRRWLERPTPMSVRALRVAFLTRLFLALGDDRETAERIFETQRQALQSGVARLKQMTADSAEAGTLAGLALDLRVRQLDTTLAWMENARLELGLSSRALS